MPLAWTNCVGTVWWVSAVMSQHPLEGGWARAAVTRERNALGQRHASDDSVSRCRCGPSNGHDDLSELAALLEIAVRVRHLVEGEGAVDDRLERARLQPLDHELDCSLASGLAAGR